MVFRKKQKLERILVMLTIINHRVFKLNKTMKHVLAHLLVFALVVTSVLVVPASDSYAASAVKKSKGDKRSAAMELISKDGAVLIIALLLVRVCTAMTLCRGHALTEDMPI